MSEPTSVVFKRSRTKHAQRSRVSTPNPGESQPELEAANGEVSPSTLATKLKNKVKARAQPKSPLSFGGNDEEGEEEVFKVRKSSLSQKLTLGKSTRIIPPSFEPTVASLKLNDGPVYDSKYLSELKASTPSSRPSLPTEDSYDVDMSVDPESLGQSSSLSSVIDLSMEMESETIIPSESSVMVAKQKRERLRASGASGEDYISLSVSKRSDFSQGPHPESRLMREDDELGDADDEYAQYTSAQERIALGKKSRKAEARKLREEMNEMIVDAEEQDEETMEWEEEQLRRGGMRVEELAKEAPKLTYKPAPIPAVTPIPTLGASIARLTQSLTSLTTSHAEHSASMAKLGEEQRQLESREKDMREMIAKAEEKRSWFSAFREWVESVATFLDEKYPQLEKLEDEHVSLLKERADMISQRRLAEDEDDLSLFFGSLPESQPTPTEELGDLGRIVQHANPAAVRRDRLTTRRARRSRRAADRAQTEEEGYSTDSSLPPLDAADYKLATGNLALKAREIMSDVKAEEFKNPDVGLSKWFGEWRARFGDSYIGAWGGLGMVGAWEFWVRLEILGWSPLEQTRSLDSFSWYGALYVYSRPGELQDDEEPEMGPDGDLLSAMISTAVIPRICKVLESGGFDPYSAKEVKNLVDLAEQIEVSVGKDTAKFEALLKSAFTVFQAAVRVTDGLIPRYLSLNKPRFDPEAIPARRRFLMRRYKLLRNIIQWRKYSGEKFGIGSLVTELVSGCMLPVAESGWEVGGGDCMRKVLQILPNGLIPAGVEARLAMS